MVEVCLFSLCCIKRVSLFNCSSGTIPRVLHQRSCGTCMFVGPHDCEPASAYPVTWQSQGLSRKWGSENMHFLQESRCLNATAQKFDYWKTPKLHSGSNHRKQVKEMSNNKTERTSNTNSLKTSRPQIASAAWRLFPTCSNCIFPNNKKNQRPQDSDKL